MGHTLKRKPSTIKQYRTLFLRGDHKALLDLIQRIASVGEPEWMRNEDEETAVSKMNDDSYLGFCFECAASSTNVAGVVWITLMNHPGEFKINVYPPLNVYGQLSINDYNSIIGAFRAKFQPLFEEFADCNMFEPEEVTIEDFAGAAAATAFNRFVSDYHSYRKGSLSDPHQSDKWTEFVCAAYRGNAGNVLASSTLKSLLTNKGIPDDYAQELGTQWERSVHVLNKFLKDENSFDDNRPRF